MIDAKTREYIEKLVQGCNGDIPLLIAELEKVKLRHPDKTVLIEALELGAKQAIGKV